MNSAPLDHRPGRDMRRLRAVNRGRIQLGHFFSRPLVSSHWPINLHLEGVGLYPGFSQLVLVLDPSLRPRVTSCLRRVAFQGETKRVAFRKNE
jgi:hypothetical protein